MRKRIVIVLSVAFVALAIVTAFIAVLVRRPPQRRTFRQSSPFRPASAPGAVKGVPPIGQWTTTFLQLEDNGNWEELDGLLDRIEQQHPDLYAHNSLGYLHARARIARESVSAEEKLTPWLARGSQFRDLALFHQSEAAVARNKPEEASRERRELVLTEPGSLYRQEAIEEELAFSADHQTPKETIAFASQLYPGATAGLKRDLDAASVEALVRAGDIAGATARALAILKGGSGDDAADRAARALDRPETLARLAPDQLATVGETLRDHRHFVRAVSILGMALGKLPAKRDELQFSIGRAYFGNEQYAQAEQTYAHGASSTADSKAKSTFLFHAARAAQLQGDDVRGEQYLTAAIAVPGRFPSTSAAITQRMRTRLIHNREKDAVADLQLLMRIAPKEHAPVEASLAHAVWLVARNHVREAVVVLNGIPNGLLDLYDAAEIGYWRGRALETTDPHQAVQAYVGVLRAPVPTHFAYFARDRLRQASLATIVKQELATRDTQVAALMAAKKFEDARQIATDRLLLTPGSDPAATKRLEAIYRELPKYRAVLDLQASAFPAFPLEHPNDRGATLLAMGLFDDAIDLIPRRYPLHPSGEALTQSEALNRGSASKESILAVEILMKSVPSDYVPDLLPRSVRMLLYPRYFLSFIQEDSTKYGADPALVLSIMREESRFNPRAKSQAAARGLLQFIITTAREIGNEVGIVDLAPEDLYDPRIIIRLGAKYVSELMNQFGGDRYKAAAAYNAGPHQVALWSRFAPAAGPDFFLSTINFDETKHYVRKVLNSYKRYGEIYGETSVPQGGVRAEP